MLCSPPEETLWPNSSEALSQTVFPNCQTSDNVPQVKAAKSACEVLPLICEFMQSESSLSYESTSWQADSSNTLLLILLVL